MNDHVLSSDVAVVSSATSVTHPHEAFCCDDVQAQKLRNAAPAESEAQIAVG